MAEIFAELSKTIGETRVLYREDGTENLADIAFDAPVHKSDSIDSQFLPFAPAANDSQLFIQLTSHDFFPVDANERSSIAIAVEKDEARQFFQRFDARIVDIVCENCTKWFNKSIPTETIRRYCQSALAMRENRTCLLATRQPVQNHQQQTVTTPICQFSWFDVQDDPLFAQSCVPLGAPLPEPHRWETRTDLSSLSGKSVSINLRLVGLHFSGSSCEPVFELSNMLVADNLLGTEPAVTSDAAATDVAVTDAATTPPVADTYLKMDEAPDNTTADVSVLSNIQEQQLITVPPPDASNGFTTQELALDDIVLGDLDAPQDQSATEYGAKHILVTTDDVNSDCADSTVTGDERDDIESVLRELFSPETIERTTVYSDLSVINRERISALMRLTEHRIEDLLQTKVDLKIVQQEAAKRYVSGKRTSTRFAEEQRLSETLQNIYSTFV